MVNGKRNLLSAEYVWGATPMPALATKVIDISEAGIYTFRVTEGIDVYGKETFKVEVKNVFGFYDNFCDIHTDDYESLEHMETWYTIAKEKALEEYTRLQEKHKRRLENEK